MNYKKKVGQGLRLEKEKDEASHRSSSKMVAEVETEARTMDGRGDHSTRQHLLDDAVERRALVAVALLASGQGLEVGGSLGDNLAVQAHHNATSGLTTDLYAI